MSNAKKSHWLRNTIIVLLVCGIVGTAVAAVGYVRHPDRTSATASLQLSFDGAADGLAPNGNQYNVDGLRSEEVLEAALKASGLEGVYTTDQLRDNLQVTGIYPDNLVKQVMSYESLMSFTANRELTVSEYHPTVFTVALYNDFDKGISRTALEGMLQSVLDSFRDQFARDYSPNLDWQAEQIYQLDRYDYPQQLQVIQEIITQQANYAQQMYEKEASFLLGGKGFNDIYVRFNSLIESDIARLNANITINALTRNTARLMTQYQFEIADQNNQLAKRTDQLQRMEELLDSYEKNEIIYLSTTDSLTKIDGNSSETYDSLVAARKEVSDEITKINSRIMTFQLRLADLMKEEEQPSAQKPATKDAQSGDIQTETMEVEEIQELTEEEIEAAARAAEEKAAAQTAALEKSIDELVARYQSVVEDFSRMLQAFSAEQINEQTLRVSKWKYNAPRLLSVDFIKRDIMTAGPICALGFIVCMALLIRSRRREEKRRENR